MFLLRRQRGRPRVCETFDDGELQVDVARRGVTVVGVAFGDDRSKKFVEGRKVVQLEFAQDLSGGGHGADPVVFLLLQAFFDQLQMRSIEIIFGVITIYNLYLRLYQIRPSFSALHIISSAVKRWFKTRQLTMYYRKRNL